LVLQSARDNNSNTAAWTLAAYLCQHAFKEPSESSKLAFEEANKTAIYLIRNMVGSNDQVLFTINKDLQPSKSNNNILIQQ